MSGFQSYPSLNAFTSGLRVNNPRPLDANEGPWFSPGVCGGFAAGTTSAGVALVNLTISPTIRYQGQKVVIIGASNPGGAGVTQAYVFWYRGGTGDANLVEFASGAAASGFDFPAGISAAGATFTRLVAAYQGISVNGNANFGSTSVFTGLATFNGGISAATFTGNLSGNASTATTLQTSRGFSLSGDVNAASVSFNGGADVTLITNIAAGAIIDADINAGANIAVTKLAANKISGITLGENLATLTIGTGLGGGSYNGSGAVTITNSGVLSFNGNAGAVTGASLGANTFNGLQTSSSGFSGPLTGAVTGNASTATTLETSRGFSLSGDVTAPAVNFNGSASVTLATTIANNAVTTTKIADANVTNAKLANSTISGIALGGTLNTLTIGTGLGGGSYNGGSAVTITNSGVLSFNGNAGAVTGASLGANTFSGLQVFGSGFSAASSTVNGNLTVGSAGTVFNSNGNATIGGTLNVNGNFYVDGTLTTVNRTTLSIDDINVTLGATTESMTDALAAGGGIILKGANDKSILYRNVEGGEWESNQHFDLATSSLAYKIAGVTALSSTALGSGIVSSSLTSVATLTSGTWNASVIGMQYGGVGGNISSVANGGVLYKTASGVTATALGTATQVIIGGAVPTWANFTDISAGKIRVQNRNTTQGEMYLTFTTDSIDNADLFIDKSSGITYDASTNLLSCRQLEALIDGGTWT